MIKPQCPVCKAAKKKESDRNQRWYKKNKEVISVKKKAERAVKKEVRNG